MSTATPAATAPFHNRLAKRTARLARDQNDAAPFGAERQAAVFHRSGIGAEELKTPTAERRNAGNLTGRCDQIEIVGAGDQTWCDA